MTYTERFDHLPGTTCYAKARPLDEATWSNGIVTCTPNGNTGEFVTGALTSGVSYAVYEQLGASPSSLDTKIARIDPETADIQIALSKLRNAKVK